MMADFENAEFYYCVHQWRAATYIHIYPFVMRSSPLLGIGMHNQRIWGLKDYQEGHSSYFMSIIRREILLFFLLGLLLCVFSCNLSMLCLNDEQKKSTTDIIYIVVTFLSMSLLGASRSYFFPFFFSFLTLHEISLYFTLVTQNI